MGFDYENLTGEKLSQQIADNVNSVLDISHIDWNVRETDRDEVKFEYNNTASNEKPPLEITIIDDDVIKLSTSPYNERTLEEAHGRITMAEKYVAKEESALEWVKENLNVPEHV